MKNYTASHVAHWRNLKESKVSYSDSIDPTRGVCDLFLSDTLKLYAADMFDQYDRLLISVETQDK